MKLDIVSGIALLLSVIGFVFSILSWRRNKDISTYTSSTQAVAQVERSLADIPSAFRFHGVTPEMLEEVGVTPAEFAYLAASFSAGRIFHFGVNPNSVEPFEKDGYRYTILKSPDTRRAWPLLKKMVSPGKFRDKVEATIKAIEDEENNLAQKSKIAGQVNSAKP